MAHLEQNYAKKTALNTAVDNLGEEIAADINTFERNIEQEQARVEGLVSQINTFQDDLKICQISIARLPLAMEAQGTGNPSFSEDLVKQLLRQGEDRKTSVEETKLLASRIQEVKLTQKRLREQNLKLSKQLGQTQEENRKQDHYIEKLRHVVSKLNQVSTGVKFQKAEFVHREDLVAVKSQINQAFRTLMALHEDAITRDSVIVESLLET